MAPSLPQHAVDTLLRRAELELARAAYRYSYTYPPGVAFAESVPLLEEFSIPYLAEVIAIDARIRANHVATDLGGLAKFTPEDEREVAAKMSAKGLRQFMFDAAAAVANALDPVRLESVSAFARFFALIEPPPVVSKFHGSGAEPDRLFAWQRLAGANPMPLRGVREMPDHFPVTAAHFERALGDGDTLEAALAEGRLFLADYAILDGVANGTVGDIQQYLYAPLALFVRPKDGRAALLPVAIQTGQVPSDKNPILTPKDGWAWVMARTIVQIADGNDHETAEHLGRAHCVMEAVVLAAHRNLPSMHPLKVLLTPHFEYTLALNDVAKHSLIAPGGGVERVLGATLEGSVTITGRGLASFRLDQSAPDKALAARGVTDRAALPEFPYRDDALDVYAAIRDFVGSYVEVYYEDDATVGRDAELRGFLTELAAQDGGRIAGVPVVETREVLAEVMSSIIFVASAQHSALNYAQFPFMGMVPNLPGAGYTTAPTDATSSTERHYLDLLPPADVAAYHFSLSFQLSSIRRNHLGKYSLLHFTDLHARSLAERFSTRLSDVDLAISVRDSSRFLSYPYLRPSMIAASIHI